MKKLLKSFKFLDIPIFLVVAFITSFSFFIVYALEDEDAHVIIKYREKEWIYPLSATVEVEVKGAIGLTKIRIEDNKVVILSSPCPHKTCVSHPALTKVGDWNACLPNQVFLYIKKK